MNNKNTLTHYMIDVRRVVTYEYSAEIEATSEAEARTIAQTLLDGDPRHPRLVGEDYLVDQTETADVVNVWRDET